MSNVTKVFPAETRDVVFVTDEGAFRFVHSYCTADIKRLADGKCVEAFFPNDKGRILAHTWCHRRGDVLVVSGAAGTASVLMQHLGKYALFETVSLGDQTAELRSFLVVGEAAVKSCEDVLDGSADAWWISTHEASAPATRVFANAERIEEIRAGFLSLGQEEGTPEEQEYTRIVAGIPLVSVDVSDANLVQEAARTELAVSFSKGCYLGQEPIARLDAMGHTNKELRAIRLDQPVEAGAEVTFDGKVVGTVSSAASFEQKDAALAVLRTTACKDGTQVSVGDVSGTVIQRNQ